jgi:outer membrane receptor protein involved in Fe transport
MNARSLWNLRAALALILGASLIPSAVAQAEKPATAAANEEPQEEAVKIEKFEVTGSRIKRTDAEGPSPVKIITRVDIQNSGRSNLTDLLRDLPESAFTGINEGGTISAVRGSTALNLRNLGANNTLVIVDGRRTVVTANASGGTTFVDLNRFPISMIERIEVLKDGASAVYGADATAGVVNIILRRDFTGSEVAFSYGNSTRTDAGEKTYSVFTGASSRKATVTLGVAYFERGGVKAIDLPFSDNADLSQRYLALGSKYADRVAGGFYDLRSGTGPQARIGLTGAATGQVQGVNGVNIPGLAPGTVINRLPGTGGVVPSGSGALLGTLSSATPSFSNPATTGSGGTFNAGLAATYVSQILTPQSNPSNLYNFQEFVWLVPEVQRTSLFSTFRYDLTNNIQFYGKASYQQNKSHIELAPSPISTAGDNNIIVPKSNYWNPFGVDVSFNFRPVDIGPRKSDATNDSYNLLFGLRGTLLDKWDWDAAYTYGWDQVVDVTTNAISESRLRAALARTDSGAFNVFGGAAFKNNPATLDSIRVQSQRAGNAALDLWDARISGPLVEEGGFWYAGEIGAAIYTEIRKEKFNVANDAISTTLDDIIGQVRLSNATQSRRTVKSAAAELRVPLVRTSQFPGVYKFDLSAAARFEDFSDGYDSGYKPYFGVRYQPIRDLLLRASTSRTFRAPTLPQLYGGETQSLPNGLPDLRRPQALTGDPFDGSATQRLVRAGGNPALTPETAKNYQYGFLYDVPGKLPLIGDALKGLQLGASYYQIEQSNIITTTGTTYVRNNEVGGGTADLVIRDPGTETYTNNTASPINVLSGPNGEVTAVQPGQTVTVPGRIRAILDRVVNLAYQKVSGYDFEVIYKHNTASFGTFNFRSTATYTKFYGFTRTPNVEPANLAGRSGYPRYRLQSFLDWNKKNYSAGVRHNYIHRYGDFARDGYEVGRYYTVGAYVGYDIPSGISSWLDKANLVIGVDNAFDKRPPLYYDAVGYDQGYVARPAGRFFYVNVRKQF